MNDDASEGFSCSCRSIVPAGINKENAAMNLCLEEQRHG